MHNPFVTGKLTFNPSRRVIYIDDISLSEHYEHIEYCLVEALFSEIDESLSKDEALSFIMLNGIELKFAFYKDIIHRNSVLDFEEHALSLVNKNVGFYIKHG